MLYSDMKIKWRQHYPASWPVLAFSGAPATYPVQLENKHLQKCLNWNDDIVNKAKIFIKTKLPKGAFIGIHLRNGIDWVYRIRLFVPRKYYLRSTSNMDNIFIMP